MLRGGKKKNKKKSEQEYKLKSISNFLLVQEIDSLKEQKQPR